MRLKYVKGRGNSYSTPLQEYDQEKKMKVGDTYWLRLTFKENCRPKADKGWVNTKDQFLSVYTDRNGIIHPRLVITENLPPHSRDL